MRISKSMLAVTTALAALCAGGAAFGADAVPDYVAAAVADGGRPYWDIARDDARKPTTVLTFARVKPGQVVAELVPGDAYYTRMLTKVVRPGGRVYAVVPHGGGGPSRSSRMQQRVGKLPAFVPADEGTACSLGCYETGAPGYMLPVDEVLALENASEYANLTVLWEEYGQYGGELALPDQADVVFTVGGYHDMHRKNLPDLPPYLKGRNSNEKPLDVAAFDKGVFRALKPGGFYVVSDYATTKGAGFGQADALHRTDPDATKAEILSAGFVLDGESNALANPADDHTTPATGKAAELDKLDRYLFRFEKPINAPNTDKRPTAAQEAAIMKNYFGNTVIGNIKAKGVSAAGARLRTSFYNPDHTYEEFGRLGEGPGPMQQGTWWWDADGHNCELHQYPIDERANVVCHTSVVAMPVGVPQGEPSGPQREILKGHVHKGWTLPE